MRISKAFLRKAVLLLTITVFVLILVLAWMLVRSELFPTSSSNVPKNTDAASSYYEAPSSVFLGNEEEVLVHADGAGEVALPIRRVLYEYVEVTGGCGVHYEGVCVNVRSGPGIDYPAINQLRNHMVLKVAGKVERDGATWIKISFDEWLRYPERVATDWYISADYVQVVLDEGDKTAWENGTASTTKRILIDREAQTLYAYEDGELFLASPISTGLELTPTPGGTFTIFKKTPSRYMQGPLPGIADQYYDMPGVPWNLYFTHDGAVIHGAYWHDSFGTRYSHGCVNLPPDTARTLYDWADLGTKVIVEN